ncbi:MAG: TolC family protein [Acidobacteria bacterium]|nr:TolC family protein [Acidobacteriota bacterium]
MNVISKIISLTLRRIVIALVAAAVAAPNRSLIVYCQDGTGASGQASEQVSASKELTLPLAVEIALRTNPLMRTTATGREIADAQVQEAKAGRYPVVQLSETWINGNNPVFVFGSLLEQGRFTQQNFDLRSLNNPDPLNNFRFGVTIKLPLLDQRQTSTRVAVAKLNQRQADTEADHVAQRIRFDVLKAYYGVLLAQMKREVADEAVKLAEADVKRSRDRVETGTTVSSDLLSAEAQLAEFHQQQIQATGEIVIARAALNIALGLPVDAPQNVSGRLVAKTFSMVNQDELMRRALDHRPDYSRAALSRESRQEQWKGARSEFLPRVEVFANAGASTNKWFYDGSGDYLIGASVTFNLFDAGRKARIAQARAAAELAASEQEHLANQIRLEVVRAYQEYVSARERLLVAERVISYATEALRIVQDRYHEGLTTITEVLRAETALVRARLNLLAARYDHYVGYASVLLAAGRLTDVEPFAS